jgi:hypothetical protein
MPAHLYKRSSALLIQRKININRSLRQNTTLRPPLGACRSVRISVSPVGDSRNQCCRNLALEVIITHDRLFVGVFKLYVEVKKVK